MAVKIVYFVFTLRKVFCMKKKLLVLGLVCLLSHGVYAQDDGEQAVDIGEVSAPEEVSSSPVEANVEEVVPVSQEVIVKTNDIPDSSVEASVEGVVVKQDVKCGRCCCAMFDTLNDNKKVVAGLAFVSSVVYWFYYYGCSCCNSDTVERAQ